MRYHMIQFDTISTSDFELSYDCRPILLESDFELSMIQFGMPDCLCLKRTLHSSTLNHKLDKKWEPRTQKIGPIKKDLNNKKLTLRSGQLGQDLLRIFVSGLLLFLWQLCCISLIHLYLFCYCYDFFQGPMNSCMRSGVVS